MPAGDSGLATFSAFCSRHAGEYVSPGTVQVSPTVLVFRPDPSLPDPVVTFILSEVTTLRRDRAQAEVQIVVGKRKLRLRLLPALAERLWEVLQARCKAAQAVEIGEMAQAVDVTGPVALEINAVLTVSGTVRVTAHGMSFEPGGDARLLGQKPFSIAMNEIEAVDRADLGRRIVIRSRGRTIVLRGVGAQRAWIAIVVMLDVLGAGGSTSPIVNVSSTEGAAEQAGIFAIGARGFGYGGDPRLAAGAPSFWSDFATFHALNPGENGMELVTSERRVTVRGDAAEAFVRHLPERWLDAMGPVEREDGQWMVRGVLHHGAALEAGVLVLEPDALRFRGVGGKRMVVATRGVPTRVGADDAVVRIEADGIETRITLLGAAAQARSLATMFASTAWSSPEAGLEPHPLEADDVDRITGLTAYARILFQDMTLGSAPDAMLAPEPSQVRLTMGFLKDPPAVPFPCLLEVVNGKGRFLAPGTVVTAQPTGARSARTSERKFAIVFRFGGAVRLANRRAYFRLPVRETIAAMEGVTPEGTPLMLDGALMVNVSRRGCGFILPNAIPEGTMLTFSLMLELEQPVSVAARVMQVRQIDRQSWRIGAAYDVESEEIGARIYNDREIAFLRRRRRDD